jgi:isoleucyl-tRNA synthetase
VWLPKRFDASAVREVASGFLNRLRNTYGFFALYAEAWTPEQSPPSAERPAVDRWLLSRVDALVNAVRESWTDYDVTAGVRAIMEFCDHELSNWYVRVNRRRFWAPDAEADPAALATLHEVLTTVVQCLAPAAPFVSDAVHRRLTDQSVHLTRFPEDQGCGTSELDVAMDAVRRLASLARAAREEAGLRVRQPLRAMRVAVPARVLGPAFDGFLDLLATEVNVKSVEVVRSDEELVQLRGKPNFRTLGKTYGRDTPLAAKVAAGLARDALERIEQGESVSTTADGRTFRFEPDHIVVERDVVTDWLVRSEGPLVVALDPAITEALRQEGLAREMINRIQRLRKEAGYDYNTRIALGISGGGDVMEAIQAFRDVIGDETLARALEVGSELAGADARETVTIDGQPALITVRAWDPAAARSSGQRMS